MNTKIEAIAKNVSNIICAAARAGFQLRSSTPDGKQVEMTWFLPVPHRVDSFGNVLRLEINCHFDDGGDFSKEIQVAINYVIDHRNFGFIPFNVMNDETNTDLVHMEGFERELSRAIEIINRYLASPRTPSESMKIGMRSAAREEAILNPLLTEDNIAHVKHLRR